MALVFNYVPLPLYSDPDYEFTISLERVAYKVRLYYNTREQAWALDLRLANNDPLVLGERVVPSYPMFLDYELGDFTGCFWFEPIGKNKNETISNPFELNQYYRLYYYYYEEEEEE